MGYQVSHLYSTVEPKPSNGVELTKLKTPASKNWPASFPICLNQKEILEPIGDILNTKFVAKICSRLGRDQSIYDIVCFELCNIKKNYIL